MEKLKYFLRTAANNLWQFRTRNLLSILIICLSFLTVGVFLSLSNNLQKTARDISQNLLVVFYLKDGLEESQRQDIGRLIEESGLFTSSLFVSKQRAAEKFKVKFPELADILEDLNINPFPASYEVAVKKDRLYSTDLNSFMSMTRQREEIEDIQFNEAWVQRMKSLSRLVRAVGYFFGGILILASFFIISNVIKLNVIARKDEIEILRLVGATNSYIRIPFLMEGIVLGGLGGLLSLLFLFILITAFPVYLGSSLGVLGELVNFRALSFSQSSALVGFGSMIGFLGSLSSLSKFLKI